MKVASHSVGAAFPPNRAPSRAQPLGAPVCQALGTSVESAPNLKTDPLRGSSDAGICNPDMESPARQNNGEKFRTEPSIHSSPRVIQRPASNLQQPRLTRTGDGLKRAGDRRRPRETQRCASIHSTPADQNGRRPQGVADVPLTQREPPPATRASARAVPAPSARTKQGANRMTGLVTRDSAQHRPSDKPQSDARNFLLIADRLSPQADRLTADPCPILPVQLLDLRPVRRRGPLRPLSENGPSGARSSRHPPLKRARECSGFPAHDPSTERGHSPRRQGHRSRRPRLVIVDTHHGRRGCRRLGVNDLRCSLQKLL